jgi:CRP-like cAMP-binding protein
MQNEDIYDLLKKRLKTIIHGDEAIMALFEQNGKIMHIHKKQLLIMSGTMDDNVYFIALGAFLMSIVTEDGTARTTSFFLDQYNDFIRCPDSAYLHIPTIYQVSAVEDSIVVRFSRKFIDTLLESHPQFVKYNLTETQRSLAISTQIRDARLALTSAQFLQFLFENYPLIFRRFPAQSIAEYMGITPVWLSNLKRRAVFLN